MVADLPGLHDPEFAAAKSAPERPFCSSSYAPVLSPEGARFYSPGRRSAAALGKVALQKLRKPCRGETTEGRGESRPSPIGMGEGSTNGWLPRDPGPALCSDPGFRISPLQGSRTRASAGWPRLLANGVARAMRGSERVPIPVATRRQASSAFGIPVASNRDHPPTPPDFRRAHAGPLNCRVAQTGSRERCEALRGCRSRSRRDDKPLLPSASRLRATGTTRRRLRILDAVTPVR
jgi:hypothetical protein